MTRRRVTIAALVASTAALACAGVWGSREVCLGSCRGEALSCSDVDRLVDRFVAGDRSMWRRSFRARLDPWSANRSWPECAERMWVVYRAEDKIINLSVEASGEALLTLRILGQYADDDAVGIALVGAEVQRARSWLASFDAMLASP